MGAERFASAGKGRNGIKSHKRAFRPGHALDDACEHRMFFSNFPVYIV